MGAWPLPRLSPGLLPLLCPLLPACSALSARSRLQRLLNLPGTAMAMVSPQQRWRHHREVKVATASRFRFSPSPAPVSSGVPQVPRCHIRRGWEGTGGAARHRHHPGSWLRGSSNSGSTGSCLQAGSGVLQDLVARGVCSGTGSALGAQLAAGSVPPPGPRTRPCPGPGVPCLPLRLPVHTPGAQGSGLGDTASTGTWLVLVAQCHHRQWDVAGASAIRGPGITTDYGMWLAPLEALVSPQAMGHGQRWCHQTPWYHYRQ